MRRFLLNNAKWLTGYFRETKWLFDMLALFFIFQTFLYTANFQDAGEIGPSEALALKAVFWILIFMVTSLLYLETDNRYSWHDDDISKSMFTEAMFAKYVIRLIIYILVTIDAVLLFRELRLVFFNLYFSYLWAGLMVMIFLELARALFHSAKRLGK